MPGSQPHHDEPLRIALVSHRYAPWVGDIETHVKRLAGGLVAAGHEVTVLTHDLDDESPELEERDGVTVRRFLPLLPSHDYMASPALARHLAQATDRYDVIHAHGYHDTPAAAVARWWDGPFIFSPHFQGTKASRLRAALHVPYQNIVQRIMERADTVCVSNTERRILAWQFPAALGRSTIVTSGVEVARLRSATPAPTGDRKVVLVAGRLESSKRVELAISAMGMLTADHQLEICGDGPERPALERYVARLGLADDIQFRGALDDDQLASSLRSAACFVSLSSHEDTDSTLSAAAALGTPVVASAIPAHIDLQRSAGELVRLVEPNPGARALANAIREATQTHPAPVDVPTWTDVAERMEGIYRQALACRHLYNHLTRLPVPA